MRGSTDRATTKRVRANPETGVLAAADIYVGLTTERADCPPLSDENAASELRRLVSEGRIDWQATEAVLVAAGYGKPPASAPSRQRHPGGLSRREHDVNGNQMFTGDCDGYAATTDGAGKRCDRRFWGRPN